MNFKLLLKSTFLIFSLLAINSFQLNATAINDESTITGHIVDDNGTALIGATIYETSTNKGTVSDINGDFSLTVSSLPTTINVSYIGYVNQIIEVSDAGQALQIILNESSNKLDEVVIVGTRGKPRTILTSAVPIDNINAAELKSSGQKSIDQMINYKVPSYNSSNQTISDATAHFDPGELRNMGPSRTLILVNGKRKNQSALVYVNDTPGKGEVGTDLKSIPTSAIERIEVLRDGASAQYGSDAVAGVINIILKERPTEGEIDLETGITTKGDGLLYSGSINKGFKMGDAGFINLTGSFAHQDKTNRAGEPGGDGLFGVIFGDDAILNGTHPWLVDNPDMGMTIGQPEMNTLSAYVNMGMPYNGGVGEFYAFGGYTYRTGTSFALYRAPYWITDDSGLLTPSGETYNGFQPTFETTINDIAFTVGNKYNFNGWNTDISLSTGTNGVDYLIGNTINVALGANSPTEFDPGGYTFGHILANADVSRSWDAVTFSLGTEFRREQFEVRAGQEESYVDGGAQSFPGLQPGNALKENRTNIGLYTGLDWDVTEGFLLGAAARFENYSDFGGNFSWKFNARQILGDNQGAIRASVSTGFRAPSLHQIYLSNVQTLVSGGTVSNQGTFNNVSDVIKGLGIDALDAEKSLNLTAGITYKLADHVSLTADYYNIAVDNRVLFTGEIGFDGDENTTNPVETILIDNDVTSIKFFVNAMDTKTSGFDLVLNLTDLSLGGDNELGLIFALNANKTKIDGDIKTPENLAREGYSIFNRKEESRITSARPNLKFTLGGNFKFGKLHATLNNTYFGEVTWQHAANEAMDQTFAAKLITDLIIGYHVSDRFSIDLTALNLFNVYPDPIDTKGDFVTDLGGRFKWPWEVNQFGFNGTYLKLGANIKL